MVGVFGFVCSVAGVVEVGVFFVADGVGLVVSMIFEGMFVVLLAVSVLFAVSDEGVRVLELGYCELKALPVDFGFNKK